MLGQALYTNSSENNTGLSERQLLKQKDVNKMDENDSKQLASFLQDAEVKIVWREEDKTKVGRGKITNDDNNFVYLTGEKGTVIVNKRDIIAIKQ